MIKGKKILVLGMARSGIAVAKLLAKYQNEIIITDMNEQETHLLEELENLGIQVIISKNQEEFVQSSLDFVIKNPAIKADHLAVLKARHFNIPVINEMEASFSFLPNDVTIIGITGSNGKTTTTTLVYELLKTTKHMIHLGGNIGIPLSSFVENVKSGDILVLEISDHQLCDMYQFKTDISVITNLSEVHLDFHGSYDAYKKIKMRIFNHHTAQSIAILNKDNEDVLNISKDIASKKIYFSSKDKADAYLENGHLIYKDEVIVDCKDITIKGVHNYENILVSIIIAKMFGATNENIQTFLKNFKGVAHRIEFVRELHGRKFYNDSKATNNQSTIIALDSFSEPTLLIMGGLDRNIPFDDLRTHLKNVKAIFCYGETKAKIKDFALENGKDVFVFDSLIDATKKAYEMSASGDIILFSPACASWDQYKDFEIRGDEFKNLVRHLD